MISDSKKQIKSVSLIGVYAILRESSWRHTLARIHEISLPDDNQLQEERREDISQSMYKLLTDSLRIAEDVLASYDINVNITLNYSQWPMR